MLQLVRGLSALVALGLSVGAPRSVASQTPSPRLKVVVAVFDGLRPDHITSARTPFLDQLAARGVRSARHHSLFPTVTRVNASALATGAHPGGHGILDNTIFLPSVDSTRTLNTGEASDMQRANRALSGGLLTAPTLWQRLQPVGMRLLVSSAGSSGSAYLLAGTEGAPTINADLVAPEALVGPVARWFGPFPADASPNLGRNARAVDALLRVGIDSLNVDVAYLWLSDPDHTAHGAGLGSVMADSSIRAADREFGRLLAGLESRGLTNRVDVIVVSDHGFSTHTGDAAATRALFAPFGNAITVAGGAVHVRRGGDSTRAAVVKALQGSTQVGAVFTAPLSAAQRDRGTVPGTLSYASIGWQHPRSADVLFSADWSHEINTGGHAGSTKQTGVAGHGTSSPYDIVATFVAAGPHIAPAREAPLPSSNADIVPTVLHLLGLPPTPAGVTGRPLLELLRDGKAAAPRLSRDSVVAEVPGYRTTLYRTQVNGVSYFDSTRTQRR